MIISLYLKKKTKRKRGRWWKGGNFEKQNYICEIVTNDPRFPYL